MLDRLAFLSALLAAGSAAAQTAPCLAFNDTNTTVSTSLTASPFVGRNPNSRAYQFTPATTLTVQAAAIFTASPLRDDYMRLEIWDEDPTTFLPLGRLTGGTLLSQMSTTANWIGTNFGNVVTLNAGTNYWLVWVESGGSIVPEEPGGATSLNRRTRQNVAAWGAAAAATPKLRIFCSPLDAQNVSSYGPACATSSGLFPSTFTNSPPTDGNALFGFEGTNFPPAASALLVIGLDPLFVTTPLGPSFPVGCALNSDIVLTVGGTTGTAEIGDQPNSPRPVPFGYVRFPLPIPSGFVGAYISGQIFALDVGSPAPVPLVAGTAVRVTVY